MAASTFSWRFASQVRFRWAAWGLAAVVVAALLVGAGEREALADEADPAASDPAALVLQLGDESFERRMEAEQQLAKIAEVARPALRQGLQAADLQIRRTCRRLLDDVADTTLQTRLAALQTDMQGSADHDLPGWKAFRETIGSDEAARKLYLEIAKGEQGLLESYQAGATASAEALRIRLNQIRTRANGSDMFGRRSKQQGMPDFASLAAILFVSSDPARRPSVNDLSSIMGYFQQQDFIKRVQQGPEAPAVQRLVGQFILSANDQVLMQQSMQLAVMMNLKEPGLQLALRALLDKEKQPPHVTAGAIGVTCVLGGKDYARAILPLLDDERLCGIHMINNNRVEIQVRDSAVGWLVHVSGQNLTDYGLSGASAWFEQVKRYPQNCFSVGNITFQDAKKRTEAIDKLKKWAADNDDKLAQVTLKPVAAAEPAAAPAAGAAPANVPVGIAGGVARIAIAAGGIRGGKQPAAPQPPKLPAGSATLPVADYEIVQQLKAARKLIEEDRFAEAVTLLGALLELERDSIYQPERAEDVFRSIKAEAESLIGGLPAAGLREYELQFGPTARKRLNDALDADSLAELNAVQRCYFHTESGRQAAYLLAVRYRNRDRHQLAAVYLQRLQRSAALDPEARAFLPLETAACLLSAGLADAVREQLTAWKRSWPHSAITIGDRDVPLFGDGEDSYLWLKNLLAIERPVSARWLVWRGDLSGSKTAAADAPYPDPSRVAGFAANDERQQYVAKLLDQAIEESRQRRLGVAPTIQPLVVGDLLVQRTPTGLIAVDRHTGTPRWSVPAEHALMHLLKSPDEAKRTQAADAVRAELQQRLWQDMAWGAISGNGRLVFAVEDLGFDLGDDYQRIITRLDGTRQLDASVYSSANLLSAYEARTGKLVWQVGEAFGQATPGLEGGRFLGPPLPLDHQLFAVVDFTDHTRLVQLDADSGRLDRQWVLDVRETPMPEFMPFEMLPPQVAPPVTTSPPVFHNGVLICGTPEGRFFAFDVVSGVPLWSHRLETTPSAANGNINFVIQMKMNGMTIPKLDATDGWASTSATIHGGKVLLTAVDANQLHCVDLATGKLEWMAERKDGLFVASVDDRVVLVAGRTGLYGLRPDDGKPAWPIPQAPLPAGAVPAGLGYAHEGRYYLPLSTNEIAGFDLATGRLAARISPRESVALGNLIPVDDSVLSVTAAGTQRFELLAAKLADVEAALQANPKDPEKLGERARIALAAGEERLAVDLLVQARMLQGDKRLDELLLDAVLQAVAKTPEFFAEHEQLIAGLLPNQPDHCDDWLTLAELLAANSRPLAALDIYERIAAMPQGLDQWQAVSAARAVRLERRLIAGLIRLQQRAGDPITADSPQIVARLTALVDKAANAEPPLVALVDSLATPEQRLWQAERIGAAKRSLEAEMLLAGLTRHGDATQLGDILEMRASILDEAKRAWEAGVLRRAAAAAGIQPLPDVIAVNAPPAAADPDWMWAAAGFEVNTKPANRSQQDPLRNSQQIPVLIESADGRWADELTVTYDTQTRALTAVDRWGRSRFSIVLPQPGHQAHIYLNPYYAFFHGVTIGHYLVVHRGDIVVAIDGLADPPKLLWSKAAHEENLDQYTAQQIMNNRLRNRMMGMPDTRTGTMARSLAAGVNYVCFQRGRELLAVHPVSGQVLWSRDDLPFGCDIVGNERHVFATTAEDSQMTVFDAIDGERLRQRKSRDLTDRIAVLGGSIVVVDSNAQSHFVSRYDLFQGEYAWKREFPNGSQINLAGRDQIGVFEPSGKLNVLDAHSGESRWSAEVGKLDGLKEITLLPFKDMMVLAAHIPPKNNGQPVMMTRQFSGTIPMDGKLIGIRPSDGKVIWTQPIANQLLRIDQPAGLPLLVACNRFQKPVPLANNSWRYDQPVLLLQCLDVRDGKLLVDSKTENRYMANYSLTADPQQNRATLDTSDHAVEIRVKPAG